MKNKQQISITIHAIKRLRERFRLLLPSFIFRDKSTIEEFLKAQLSTSTPCVKWTLVPFYVNMVGTMYGENVEVFTKSGVYYICNRQGKLLILRTVVRDWWCEGMARNLLT